MDMFTDDYYFKRLDNIDKQLGKKKNKKEIEGLKKKKKEFEEKVIKHSHKWFLSPFKASSKKIVKCVQCKKKLKQIDSPYSANVYWCIDCYRQHDKDHKAELERVFGDL